MLIAQKTIEISIHAPRMGSDASPPCTPPWGHYFNPRSPDGERRSVARAQGHDERYFNPRSPDGERPAAWSGGECQIENFNPRSPDGERRQPGPLRRRQHAISIHAPRMGSDRRGRHLPGRQLISIHAPRMGSDHPDVDYLIVANQFQSTLPGWGATRRQQPQGLFADHFNPRSPDGERLTSLKSWVGMLYFNPRSPDGERPMASPAL